MVTNIQTSTSLRRAARDDQELLLTLIEEYYRLDHLSFDRERAREALVRMMDDEALGFVWIIEAGTISAGYVVLSFSYSLEYHGRDAFVDEIFLREEFRGRGVGGRAIDLVVDEARRLGVKALHLEVERDNKMAQAFYRKVGFADHDRYLMTRRLT